jgi:predicted Zn-dependent protease with MMP-like domain
MADHDDLDSEAPESKEERQLRQQLEEGWQALERGKIAEARAHAGQALAASPGAAEALLLEAACLRDEGEGDGAIAVLRRVVESDAEWCTPELWLAELLAMKPDAVEEALEHAARALDLADDEDEYLNALVLKAGLEADLGEIDEAKETLEELPAPEVVLDDPLLALEIAELLLAVGQPAAARERLRTLTGAEPDMPDAWYALGLAAEALSDDGERRRAWKRAWELDSEEAADQDAAGRLDEQQLIASAEQALAELPDKARGLLTNVPIIVADLPAAADVDGGLDPRLLGLFSGTPYPESSNLGGQPGLTQIILFRRNLERAASGADELRDEIRTTLLHETGHFFGLDEAQLEALGLD